MSILSQHAKNRRKRSKFLIRSYYVFSEFTITKRYVEQMRKRYEIISPEDLGSLMCKTMGMCYLVWGSSILLLILIFGCNPSLYTATLAILSVWILHHEYLERKVNHMELLLMNQLDRFLSDTRHSFYLHGMIDEAISDASERCGRIMKLNAVKLQRVLDSTDLETAIRRYNETVSNRFLRMLLSLTVYVSEFGDKLVNGVSILLLNIHTLKSDIYIELMNRRETEHKFSGMVFITLAPMYLLGPIKAWAISTSPDLAGFYEGTMGITLTISILLLTVIMYVMVNELKDRNEFGLKEHFVLQQLAYLKPIHRILNNYGEKNRVKFERQEELLYRVGEKLTAKHFLLKRMIYAVLLFLLCVLVSMTMHHRNREKLLTSQRLTSNREAAIPEKMKKTVGETVVYYMKTYLDQPMDKQRIEKELIQKGQFRSELIRINVIDEIIYRRQQYGLEYYHWYELLFALAASAVGFWFPYWMLYYRKKVLALNMGNEVAQFQSTIMLVMNLDTTTVLKVLELMESFAIIFKESIKICINEYSTGDLDALEKLKLRERYEPFRRLVDNLIIADKIGVQKAFDEITEERKVSQEMRNQDYRIARDKKVMAGAILSFLPATITIALYWVVPFALDALSGLKDYDLIMNAFR